MTRRSEATGERQGGEDRRDLPCPSYVKTANWIATEGQVEVRDNSIEEFESKLTTL